jgi:bifunctional non-homologous end joining protein LigD
VSGGRLRLDRDGVDLVGQFPELRQLGDRLAPTECVLDGVVAAFDEAGRVSREVLESRLSGGRKRVPVQYLLFDLLWLDGQTLLDLPYPQRRELLDGMELAGPHWLTPPHFVGAGAAALDASREQGSLGVVAKRLDSPYRPGKRSRDWLLVRSGGRRAK